MGRTAGTSCWMTVAIAAAVVVVVVVVVVAVVVVVVVDVGARTFSAGWARFRESPSFHLIV